MNKGEQTGFDCLIDDSGEIFDCFVYKMFVFCDWIYKAGRSEGVLLNCFQLMRRLEMRG